MSKPGPVTPAVAAVVPLAAAPRMPTTLLPSTLMPVKASMPRWTFLLSVTLAMSTSICTCGSTTSICLTSSRMRLRSSCVPETTIALLRSSAMMVMNSLNCELRSPVPRPPAAVSGWVGCALFWARSRSPPRDGKVELLRWVRVVRLPAEVRPELPEPEMNVLNSDATSVACACWILMTAICVEGSACTSSFSIRFS